MPRSGIPWGRQVRTEVIWHTVENCGHAMISMSLKQCLLNIGTNHLGCQNIGLGWFFLLAGTIQTKVNITTKSCSLYSSSKERTTVFFMQLISKNVTEFCPVHKGLSIVVSPNLQSLGVWSTCTSPWMDAVVDFL